MDSHIVPDFADLKHLETASYGLMRDPQRLAEESGCRLVLCGLSPNVKWQLRCVRLSRQFDTFNTREAAIMELSHEDGDRARQL